MRVARAFFLSGSARSRVHVAYIRVSSSFHIAAHSATPPPRSRRSRSSDGRNDLKASAAAERSYYSPYTIIIITSTRRHEETSGWSVSPGGDRRFAAVTGAGFFHSFFACDRDPPPSLYPAHPQSPPRAPVIYDNYIIIIIICPRIGERVCTFCFLLIPLDRIDEKKSWISRWRLRD